MAVLFKLFYFIIFFWMNACFLVYLAYISNKIHVKGSYILQFCITYYLKKKTYKKQLIVYDFLTLLFTKFQYQLCLCVLLNQLYINQWNFQLVKNRSWTFFDYYWYSKINTSSDFLSILLPKLLFPIEFFKLRCI